MPPLRGAGSPAPIQVWVVGSHELLNRAFEALLVQLPGVELAGRVTSLDEIPPQSCETEACLILWVLPFITDLDPLANIQTQHLFGKVLLFSMGWTTQHVQESLAAGAAGCLSTHMSLGDLGDALRQAVKGEGYLPPELARDLILSSAEGEGASAAPAYDSLTSKEKEILPLLCQGLSNKQIAQRLYLSVRTVENHLASIYEKLGVRSRTEAAVLAIQSGWF